MGQGEWDSEGLAGWSRKEKSKLATVYRMMNYIKVVWSCYKWVSMR